jgi:hypothetical protein
LLVRDKAVVEGHSSSSASVSRSSRFSLAISAVAFAAVVLVLNRDLFRLPIYEYRDFAANALQIERAKHFHEILGNYSRWGFHHPGPAFFYVFALGEKVLHDWLHVVPQEMNAHIVIAVLLHTAFLFGAIAIMARYCRSLLFPPVALGISLFFIYVVNRTIPGSAVLSVWMPYAFLFCFLFFLVVCASVATGNASDLPWMTLSGAMLVHAHVAQSMFVGVLGLCALVAFWRRSGKGPGSSFLRQIRRPAAISLVIAAIFVFPILLDVVVHRDNNVRAILHHAASHQRLEHGFVQSLKYELSFLQFVRDWVAVPEPPSAEASSTARFRPYVVAWWCLGALTAISVAGIYFKRRTKFPAFVCYAVFEIVLVAVVFVYWTLKMTGPLFNFNGYFFFSLQLLAMLLMAWLILDGLDLTVRPAVAMLLCAVLPLSMFADKRGFLNEEDGEGNTNRLVAGLPPSADARIVHLTFDQADWMFEAGIASRLQYEHRQFCVDDLWEFPFGRGMACPGFDGVENLILTHKSSACEPPCQVLAQSARFQLQLEPYPALKVPFTIKPDDRTSLNKGFNEHLGTEGPVWSRDKATIYFRLAPDFTSDPRVRVTIFGSANPGRPARILLNGHELGTVEAGKDATEFVVEKSDLMVGENRLSIDVDNPMETRGDPQNDPRVLGFSFLKAQFEPIRDTPQAATSRSPKS